ncbi:MAG: hypothetical protein KJ626_01010, partial [Verrucomicrobia bacterium]|nr:hypothetical protein [Verrucomicrobiota bacterium]
VTLSATPSAEEKTYIRLTTDGFSTYSIIPFNMTNAVGSLIISNLTDNTQYEWYAFTSTATSNYLATTSGYGVDALTLSWENNGGDNYEFGTPGEAAWIYHNDNRVLYGASNVQFWAKMGYANGGGTDLWVTNAAIYYTSDGSTTPYGGYGSASNAQTKAVSMTFDHTEQDASTLGEAMWWVGTVTNLTSDNIIKYKIGAWLNTGYTERFADYNTSGTNDATFTFFLGVTPGDPDLKVNGVNADYTTSKYFIDEIAGQTAVVSVVFTPGAENVETVEIFSNLGRRDYATVDYVNANISADGYEDGIKPPSGNYITTNDTGAYYTAWPMAHQGGGVYVWTGLVTKCGAYRLTARWTTNNQPANTYQWYSSDGRRDHAVVVSPEKVHELTMYELNTLTVEATDSSEASRSTFVDLLGAADGDSDGFDPFNLDYLNFIQANCLWFQPIHPVGIERGEGYTPGSPYATRDYFEVSHYMGSGSTEESAMSEFTNFVAKCDAYGGSVGTINVMLDGVFNHTSWDAEFGQGGVDLGYASDKGDRIGSTRPQFYAKNTDYGEQATYYNSAWDNDFATAPDRGDFGKWDDVTEFYFGKYSALVRHNPDNNGDYLNEDDVYDFSGMSTNQMDIWKYFAYYAQYWLEKTGHASTNSFVQAEDDKGIDGLRCDFGQGLPPQLWEYIINRTRSIKWSFVFMAETLDGGKPGYRSNRHFDVLNENLVFQFTQAHINDSWDVKSALEDRRNAYSGGAVLLNLTSHDEVLPDNDAWLVASRYGAVGSVDGIPMLFYGQEQGIQNYNSDPSYWYYDGFRTDHEENFGKYVPHFKQWNQLTVWSNPPPNSTGLAQHYGRINWARHNSPALRSPNRYFLSTTGGGDDAKILAVAKYEEEGASPASKDVVLCFANILRHGEAHALAANTYDLKGPWSKLGLEMDKHYQIRNLASSDASKNIWGSPKQGGELWTNGIYVSLGAGTVNSITNDGELVQYLRIVEVDANEAPVLTVPGPHTLAVGSSTNFDVTATDADLDAVLITNPTKPTGATFNGTNFAWTAGSAYAGSTVDVVFVGNDQQGESNSIVTNQTTITIPLDSDSDAMNDGWEWDNFTTLARTADGDEDNDGASNKHEHDAGTDPDASNSLFRVESIVDSSGQTNFAITVSTVPGKKYTISYTDKVLSNNVPWSAFGNAANGEWTEVGGSPTNHVFIDDFTADTTGGDPANGHRSYRVKTETP